MAKKWQEVKCDLHPDTKGVIWDLVLYVPTVGFLLLWGLKLWYGNDDQVMVGYGLMFLGSFFLMVGGGRVMRRLLIHPKAPVSLDMSRERIRLKLKNGTTTSLQRDIRFFPDRAGKSFGLTGMDHEGARQQFVFHSQQFDKQTYDDIIKALDIYK